MKIVARNDTLRFPTEERMAEEVQGIMNGFFIVFGERGIIKMSKFRLTELTKIRLTNLTKI